MHIRVQKDRHKSGNTKAADLSGQRLSETGGVLLSQAVSHQVSSALGSLTSVFGMGTGVSSPPSRPDFFFEDLRAFKSKQNAPLTLLCLFLFAAFRPSFRLISIGQLRMSPSLHLRPIDVVVSHEPYLTGEIYSCGGLRT